MIIGLNDLMTTISHQVRPEVRDAWFCQTTEDAAESVNDGFGHFKFQIHNSLRKTAPSGSAVPALPRFAEEVKAKSPYQLLCEVLDADSKSSRWLQNAGLLHKFMSTECFADMSMTAEGGVNSVLRSQDGYRRTVVCRPDGTISQRVTGPNGNEIVRFNNEGEAVAGIQSCPELIGTPIGCFFSRSN